MLDFGQKLVRLHYSTCELVDDYEWALGIALDYEVLARCWHLVAHLHLELTADRDLLVKVRDTVLAQVLLALVLRGMQ